MSSASVSPSIVVTPSFASGPQPIPHMVCPGELIVSLHAEKDNNKQRSLHNATATAATAAVTPSSLRIIQWNIERGYKLDAIIEELKALSADIIILQEIDIYCERSQWKDVGEEIAQALNMNYAFVAEVSGYRWTFHKLDSNSSCDG
jgi:hypothetical protein